jgi:hypothetical protein
MTIYRRFVWDTGNMARLPLVIRLILDRNDSIF